MERPNRKAMGGAKEHSDGKAEEKSNGKAKDHSNGTARFLFKATP